MRRHSLCNSVSAAVIGASLLGLAGAASAQDAGDQATSVDDIIVTAQKREQTLIDVPQSVSVVSGAALERNQATSFQDYAKLIPGFQISQSNPGEARLVVSWNQRAEDIRPLAEAIAALG